MPAVRMSCDLSGHGEYFLFPCLLYRTFHSIMIRHSDDLFQLIRSLSKSEKRYFKLSVSPYGGEKKYILLFDAIDAQKDYDEEYLRERFRDEKFIRQFNVAKRYLYELILKALRNYHAESGGRARIRAMMRNMEILHEKGLSRQARKMYDRAMEMSMEQEDFQTRIELIEWWERLEPEISRTKQGLDRLYGELFDVFDSFRELIGHAMISRRIALPVHSDHPRTPDELDELEQSLAMLNHMPVPVRSVRAEILRCWSLATYHFGRGEYLAALEQTVHQVELFKAHPALRITLSRRYIGALNNKLILHKYLKQEDEYYVTMEKLRSEGRLLLKDNRLGSRRTHAELFAIIYLSLLTMSIARTDYSTYHELTDEIDRGLLIHSNWIDSAYLIKLYYNLALLSFDVGEYRRALEYNLAVLEFPEPQFSRQTYNGARLLSLIIHYELGNLDLLEYLIKSTYRYFRSRQIMYRFETIVLEFFRRILRSSDRADLLITFNWLQEQFLPLRYDPQEQNMFRLFNFVYWIEEKIAELKGRESA